MKPLIEFTEDEILNLSAGRETDAMIAEYLFGVPAVSEQVWCHKIMWHERTNDDGSPGRTYTDMVRYYTTSIKQTQRLWNRLSKLGYWVELRTPYQPPGVESASRVPPEMLRERFGDGELCQCLLREHGWHGFRWCGAEAPTVELATCRAALLLRWREMQGQAIAQLSPAEPDSDKRRLRVEFFQTQSAPDEHWQAYVGQDIYLGTKPVAVFHGDSFEQARQEAERYIGTLENVSVKWYRSKNRTRPSWADNA